MAAISVTAQTFKTTSFEAWNTLKKGVMIQMPYQDAKGITKNQVVVFDHIKYSKKGDLLVFGYESDTGAWRSFRADRILDFPIEV